MKQNCHACTGEGPKHVVAYLAIIAQAVSGALRGGSQLVLGLTGRSRKSTAQAVAGLAHGALKVFTWLTDAKASDACLDMCYNA